MSNTIENYNINNSNHNNNNASRILRENVVIKIMLQYIFLMILG